MRKSLETAGLEVSTNKIENLLPRFGVDWISTSLYMFRLGI